MREDSGELRVSRWLGSFDCGRVVNPKTAASQLRGGIVMGIGMALSEETLFDERSGRIMNASLAEYHVPVNLDVPRDRDPVQRHPRPAHAARRARDRRARDHRRGRGDRQRGVPRHRQASARTADHARQAALTLPQKTEKRCGPGAPFTRQNVVVPNGKPKGRERSPCDPCRPTPLIVSPAHAFCAYPSFWPNSRLSCIE